MDLIFTLGKKFLSRTEKSNDTKPNSISLKIYNLSLGENRYPNNESTRRKSLGKNTWIFVGYDLINNNNNNTLICFFFSVSIKAKRLCSMSHVLSHVPLGSMMLFPINLCKPSLPCLREMPKSTSYFCFNNIYQNQNSVKCFKFRYFLQKTNPRINLTDAKWNQECRINLTCF